MSIQLAEQKINERVHRYLLPATISFKNCQSIPITSNIRPPIGIGYYRLSIDLDLIVQGVVRLLGPLRHYEVPQSPIAAH